uniref:Lipocalin/cytosolic fatty-acid binding domain-containing protein n=1 Tax=Graphocephala atropunctata TaxID=36148 RepID=A0A1B6MD63_9HEMI
MSFIKFCLVLVDLFVFTVVYEHFVFGNPIKSSNDKYLEPFLNKTFVLSSSDRNFDEVMKALGVGLIERQVANFAKPVMRLTKNKSGEYLLSSESTFKNTVTAFEIGKEFDDETPDGRKVKSLFIQDKNKLTQIQHGDKTTTIVREFTADEVKVTVTVDNIVSVRTYSAL